jgi:D-serine deaminase-like pyridoxal phosphate-dependent protein
MNNWFEITGGELPDSPALLVFPERVKQNIETALRWVDGDTSRLRPHIKTHKNREAVLMMMAAGISRFKCATIAEAELLGLCKAPNVVLAYQPTGPKLKRFVEVIKHYPDTHFGCLCDDLEIAREQSEVFLSQGMKIDVYIDLNVGMNRTGIIPGEAARKLYQLMDELPGIHAAGLHAYDGHQRNPDFEARTQECNKGFEPVMLLKKELEALGHIVPNIIAGGSPSFPIHAKRGGVQCSPGTFVYWDKGYGDLCQEQGFVHAAVLMTRVISHPNDTRICTDLGHKSVAAENDLSKRVFFQNAVGLNPVGQSEEHLVLENTQQQNLPVGSLLYGIPYHICPTVALYERVLTVENGTITGDWRNMARDRKINF